MSIQNTSSQSVLVNCSGGDDDSCGDVSGTSYWEEFCRRLMLHPLYLGAGRMKALRTCFCAALNFLDALASLKTMLDIE